MIRINETFEIDYDGNQWLLFQWYDGKKKVGNDFVPEKKRKGPSYYSSLVNVLRVVVDRSAGIACRDAKDIKRAVDQAKTDFLLALHGGFRRE